MSAAHRPRHHHVTVYRHPTLGHTKVAIYWVRDHVEAAEYACADTGGALEDVLVERLDSASGYTLLREWFRPRYIRALQESMASTARWSFVVDMGSQPG